MTSSIITKSHVGKNHTFDWHNKKILNFETNYYKRLILKIIHIKSQKNGINSVSDIELLNSLYFNLISKIFDNK